MNQRNKNINLIVILALLILSSIVFGLTDGTVSNTIKNTDIFSIQDTSKIDQISIESVNERILLTKIDGIWMLDNKLKAEQNIVKILLSILKDAEVTRSVPASQQKEIASLIKNKGYLVQISSDGDVQKAFYSAGNENKTVSYMMEVDDTEPYIMNIPGYGSYVAGIFEIPKNDWRDRLILSTNWRTLQKLNINYTEFPEYDLTIKFDFNFLTVEGVQKLDTSRMMAFIDEFNFLQTDRYLVNGQNEKYDSLLQTPATVSLSIEDINSDNSKSIDFFPLLPDDPMMLGYVKEDEQMVLFEAQRIQQLFAVKDDFERIEN